jgi:hypothetical protein
MKLFTQNFIALILLTSLALSGCSETETVHALDPTAQNLQYLSEAYGSYAAEKRKSPRSGDDLAPYLKSYGDPAEILRSPHDAQPYVIHWGARLESSPDATGKVFIHEQTGVEGQRWVLFTDGSIDKIDQARFDQLSPATRNK